MASPPSIRFLSLLFLAGLWFTPLEMAGQVNFYSKEERAEPVEIDGITPGEDPDKGPTSTDETSAKLIALWERAMGGREKMSDVRTLKVTGEMTIGRNQHGMVWYYRAPNSIRVEQSRRHLGWDYLTITGTDGQTAWRQVLKPKPEPPVELKGHQRNTFIRQASIWGPLFNYREAGHHFAYEGEVKIANQPTYLVKCRYADGDIGYYYFDAKRFIVRAYGFKDLFAGQRVDADRLPVRLETINGVRMEREVQYRTNGSVYKSMKYETIEINPSLSDDLFVTPVWRERWLRQE